MKMKTSNYLFGVFFLLFFGVSISFPLDSEKNTFIASNQVISESYIWAGNVLNFNGHALKDLILFGKEVVVRGVVEGDVIAFAQRIEIEGEVKGSVRGAGETIDMRGKIGKNVSLAGKYVNILKGAEIGWDLVAGAQRLSVEGKVDGDVKGGAGEGILGGFVGGNVELKLQELTVLPTTQIKGNLMYSASREATIPKEAKIEGKVIFNPLPTQPPKPIRMRAPLSLRLFWLLSLITTGAFLVLLLPRHLREMGSDMLDRPWLNIGWGFVVLIVTPISAIIIAIILIGIPLSLMSWAIYFIAIYLSTPIVGTALGLKILQRLLKREDVNLYLSMAVGVIIFYILQNMPILGWLMSLLGICWGLGGIRGALGRRIRAGRLANG
jgi:cytoskeletal protein CcmA (bactofilin family)